MLLVAALALSVCSVGCGGSDSGLVTHTQNPLVARYSVSVPPGSSAAVEFGLTTDYGFRTAPVLATAPTVPILVAGMKQNSTYHMRAVITHADGSKAFGDDHTFLTGSAPSDRMPTMAVTLPSGLTPTPGIELLSLNPAPNNPGNLLRVVALDPRGDLVWYYDFDPYLGTAQPFKLLPNGHFLMVLFGGTTGPGGMVREIDLAGKTIREFTVDQLNQWLSDAGYRWSANAIHHDIVELPNGHLLVLVNTNKKFSKLPGHSGDTTVLGDAVIDLDQNDKPVWSWSSFDHLDVKRHPMLFPDWTHTNTIEYSPADGNIVLSMRNQSWIIKIDYANGHGSGDVLWRLGYQGDFALLGSTSPSDWFFAQHYASFYGQTNRQMRLAVFDNGNDRYPDSSANICPSNIGDVQYPWMTLFGRRVPDCYSRPAVFKVNEAERTARLSWSQVVPYSYWGGVTMETSTGNIFFDVTNPSEQIVRIGNRKLPPVKAVLEESAILIVVLVVFFSPIPKSFLPLAMVPLVVMVGLFPGLGLLAVAVGLILDAAVLVLGPQKTEAAQTARPDFHDSILAGLRRMNRPSFFAVIAVALSFLPMFGPQEQLNAEVVEVTRQTPPQVVWRLDISGQESYRTVHLPSLYPDVQW